MSTSIFVPGLRLYDNPQASSPRRVRIFLAEKGVEVERVLIDTSGRENYGEAFTRLNPFRVVPVLELPDGRTIAESQAIVRYFEARFPEPPLLGRDAFEVATIEAWTRRIEHEVYLQIVAIRRHTDPAYAGRSIAGVQAGFAQVPAIAEHAQAVLVRTLGQLATRLEGHAFVAGDRFSNADILLLVALDLAARARLALALPATIERWLVELRRRPSAEA
ncbi:glutathione S-transferase family protein [Nannocystaceae bacterium ST9]